MKEHSHQEQEEDETILPLNEPLESPAHCVASRGRRLLRHRLLFPQHVLVDRTNRDADEAPHEREDDQCRGRCGGQVAKDQHHDEAREARDGEDDGADAKLEVSHRHPVVGAD